MTSGDGAVWLAYSSGGRVVPGSNPGLPILKRVIIMNENSDNKRTHKRLEQHCFISYRLRGSDAYEVSQAENYSAGGLKFNSEYEYNVGDKLELLVRFPFDPKRMPLFGEVMTVTKAPHGFDIGCKFVDIPSFIVQQINSFIQDV